LQSTGIQGKLLVSMLEAGIVLVLKDYGNHCLRYIDNALFVIQIFGLHTIKSYQRKDIML